MKMAVTRGSINVPVTGLAGKTHVKVSVYYAKGGTNLWSGKGEPRGFWASITPIAISPEGYESMLIGDSAGMRVFLAPSARFNAKALAARAPRVLDAAPSIAGAIAAGDKDNAAAFARAAAGYTGMTS